MDWPEKIISIIKILKDEPIHAEPVHVEPKKYIKYDGRTVSQNVAVNATVEFFRFQVPSRNKLIITHFGNSINRPDAWGQIIWRLKRNGVGFFPYHEIKDQLGYSSSLAVFDGIEAKPCDLFTVEVSNNYAEIVKCGITLRWQIHEAD